MANQLFKLLHGLYYTKIPTMVFGNPGCGKTSAIRFLGDTLGVTCEVRSANKSDPVDFSGLPFTDTIPTKSGKTKKVTKYSKPKYVRNLEKDKNGILFFDEITTCTPAIQTALLTIIQDCEFGEFSIPKTTYRIAAGNYNNIVGTHSMSLALLNRCVHLFVKPSVDFFCQGIVSGFNNYEYAIINSEKEIISKTIQYSIMVSDFIKQNPMYLPEEIPEEIIEHTDVAFPTSRSWENAIKILATLDKNDKDYITELLDGCIGINASKAFRKYLYTTEKFIDLLEYVGKESTLNLPHPNKHDESMHMIESIMPLIKSDPKKYIKLWVRIINILHNKNNKYGDYVGYDGFIMKYMIKAIDIFDKASLLTKDMILSLHGRNNIKDYFIDDFQKLYTLAYNGGIIKKNGK